VEEIDSGRYARVEMIGWTEDPPLVVPMTGASVRLVGVPICPDLLDYTMLGVADTWRGRWVRLLLRLAGRVK
jgi:hypothetical protein